MKYSTVILFAFVVSSFTAIGQDLTIEQALKLAQSTSVQQAQVQNKMDEINLKIQKSKRLPLIYGDANVQRNLITPVTPVPAIAFDPNAPEGAIIPLRFATDWSAKAGLQLSLDLFNPQSKLNVAAAQQQYQVSRLNSTADSLSFTNKIIDLYAQTYLAQQQYDLSIVNEDNYQQSLQTLKARYDAGRLPTLEWNKAQQKMLDLQQNRLEAEYVLRNKYVALGQYIDVTQFDNLTTAISALVPSNKESLELQQLTLDANYKQQQLQLSRLEWLPKFTLNGYLGAQHFSNEFQLFDRNMWYGNSYVNVTMRMPITELYENKLRQTQHRSAYLLAQLKLQERQRDWQTSVTQKATNITVLQNKVASLNKTIQLYQENMSILDAQLLAGTILITEYNNELDLLLKANQQLWQAQYDLLLTQIND